MSEPETSSASVVGAKQDAAAAPTKVRITDDETGEVVDVCSLAEFCEANDLDDAERTELVTYLNNGGLYRVGGGATPLYLVTAVHP
jgi:hypothetical protein